jgi:hypothetical protein
VENLTASFPPPPFLHSVVRLLGSPNKVSGEKRWRLFHAMLRGPSHYESSQNKINLDTVIYLTFVTKFSFSFQIWYIYIYKETTYIVLKQFIMKSGHKKSRDINQNDVYRKDL